MSEQKRRVPDANVPLDGGVRESQRVARLGGEHGGPRAARVDHLRVGQRLTSGPRPRS